MRTLALATIGLGLGLVACREAESGPTAREAAFCDSVVALDGVSTPGGPEGPTPDQMRAYADRVAGPAQALQSSAPTAVVQPVRTVVGSIDRARTGDTGALADGYATAKLQVEEWTYDNCGFERLTMRAADHRYSGLPETVKAGKTAVRFRNDGREFHIVLWLKRADDDNRPAAQALGESFAEMAAANFDPNRARALGFVEGEPAAAPPGQAGGTTVDLAPGRYIAFCPVGTEGNESHPHFALGMLAELIVS